MLFLVFAYLNFIECITTRNRKGIKGTKYFYFKSLNSQKMCKIVLFCSFSIDENEKEVTF